MVQPNHSGNNCPSKMRVGKVSWTQFIAMVKAASGHAQFLNHPQIKIDIVF